MKPLTNQECLLPAGNDCIVPSMLEAMRTFAEHGLIGIIKFGVAHTDEGDCLCWLLIPEEGPLRPLKAFEDNANAPVTGFKEVPIDSFFIWKDKYFKFIEDDELMFVIKEVNCFSTENDVYGYAQCKDYGEVDIYAVKLYKIGKRHEYLFPAWYMKFPDNQDYQGLFIPMFLDDTAALNSIDFNLLNWEFMDAGDTFLHGKELWRLGEDNDNGLFIGKPLPFKIISHRKRH